MGEWGNLRLRQQVIDKISEFLQTNRGKEFGYSSASQLAEYVLRNFIEDPNSNQRIEKLEKEIKELREKYREQRSEKSALKERMIINEIIEKSENKNNEELESRIEVLEKKLTQYDASQKKPKKK
ncbi:MAG: hypothetical protein COA77_04270 [Thaumarchaeota archaeon]|nr:MAG: hypothetical protein COA77_04270 [Nitrososphaerota archaeon]